MKETSHLEKIQEEGDVPEQKVERIMEVVRDDDEVEKTQENPEAETIPEVTKEELSNLYEDYLEAERQRLKEESTFLLKLKKGGSEKRKKGILIELEKLNKEEILNLNERYEILEKIKGKETSKEERRNMERALHEITIQKNKSLDKKHLLWQQMKDLDPSLLTEEQAKRLEAPLDIFSDEFLEKLREENLKN